MRFSKATMRKSTDTAWWQSFALSILEPQSGLYRADYLYDRLSEELATADGNGSRFCLLLVERNGGDGSRLTKAGVQSVAHALFVSARALDVPARLGPRRFALLLPDVSGDQARRIGTTIRLDLLLEDGSDRDEWEVSCLEYPAHRSALEQLRHGDGMRRRPRAA